MCIANSYSALGARGVATMDQHDGKKYYCDVGTPVFNKTYREPEINTTDCAAEHRRRLLPSMVCLQL